MRQRKEEEASCKQVQAIHFRDVICWFADAGENSAVSIRNHATLSKMLRFLTIPSVRFPIIPRPQRARWVVGLFFRGTLGLKCYRGCFVWREKKLLKTWLKAIEDGVKMRRSRNLTSTATGQASGSAAGSSGSSNITNTVPSLLKELHGLVLQIQVLFHLYSACMSFTEYLATSFIHYIIV